MRCVHGQRRLPYPAHAVDRHHRRGPRGVEEGIQLRPATGERSDVVRQIIAYRRSRSRARLRPVLGALPHLTQRPRVATGCLAERHHRRPGWNGLAGEVARQRGAAGVDVTGELTQAPAGQITQLRQLPRQLIAHPCQPSSGFSAPSLDGPPNEARDQSRRSRACSPIGPQCGLPPGRPLSPLIPIAIRNSARCTAQPRARRTVASSAG